MLAALKIAGLFLGGWLKKLGEFLGKLNIWQLLCIGLFVCAAALFVQRNGARDDLERANVNLREVRAELKSISDKKNEQKAETKRNIDKAEKGEREAKPIVEKIRNAPIGPNCETPGIEILRNEI